MLEWAGKEQGLLWVTFFHLDYEATILDVGWKRYKLSAFEEKRENASRVPERSWLRWEGC